MGQLKAAEVDRFVAKPDRFIRIFLFYGNDDGLISERAARLARALIGNGDPLSVVRIESSAIAADPGRLADEAYAISMFGGDRVIRVSVGGNRPIHSTVETLAKNPPTDSWVILEAGELRRDYALRKLCESAKTALALPCYLDEARDLDRIIDEETTASGLTIDPEARAMLREILGADRMASRQEVRKLCLYAAGKGAIGPDDVRASAGDVSLLAVDETIEAAALGDVGNLLRALYRHEAAGQSAGTLASAALRHFQSLHRTRLSMDSGRSLSEIVDGQRGISFSRKRALQEELRTWDTPGLERALERLEKSVFDTRLRSGLASEIVGKTLTAIALEARRQRRAGDRQAD